MNASAEAYRAKIGRVLISAEEIGARIAEAGAQLHREYEGKPVLFIGVLNGSFVFLADLCRAAALPCEIAFMCAKSYIGTDSAGEVSITLDVAQDLSKYHVILVEDIVDTGRTLSLLTALLKERSPLSLKVVTLLDKPERRVVEFQPDLALFCIPDVFIIGYGLDCDEAYRNLPYLAEYRPEA